MDYIIDYMEIVEQAPTEEPARQYYFMDRVRAVSYTHLTLPTTFHV